MPQYLANQDSMWRVYIKCGQGSPGELTCICRRAPAHCPQYPIVRRGAWVHSVALRLHPVGMSLKTPGVAASPCADKPYLHDDVLPCILSFLDPPDAARAGLACKQWHHNAAQATYHAVTLHASSKASHALARTLRERADLRQLVRHVTIMNCTSFEHDELWEWVHLLPAGALASYRVFSVSESRTAWGFEDALAVQTAGRVEMVILGHLREEELRAEHRARTWAGGGEDDPCSKIERNGGEDTCLAIGRADLSFPEAVERFHRLIGMETNPYLKHRAKVLLQTRTEDISRERVEAILQAMKGLLPLTQSLNISLYYRSIAPEDGNDTADAGTESETEEDGEMCYMEAAPCACVAAQQYARSSPVTGCVAATRKTLTELAVRKVLGWVWRERERSDGRLWMVALGLSHHDAATTNIPGEEPCAVCGLTALVPYYYRLSKA
ncbi:hypothetical protein C8Q77DRAFT_128300 [Trametes polyzona]|nr:hypothetical protein C8Q77DRAFT_128300 [Trametes polyzona]